VVITVPESTVDVLVVEEVAVAKTVTELATVLVGTTMVVETSLVTSLMVVVRGPSGPSRRTRARRAAFSSRVPIFLPEEESMAGARGIHVAVSVVVVEILVFVTVLCVCVAVEVVVEVTVVCGVKVLVPDVAGTVVTITKVFMSVTVDVIVISVEKRGFDVTVTVGVIVMVVWKRTMVNPRAVPILSKKAVYKLGAI